MTIDQFMALPAPRRASLVLIKGKELMFRVYMFYTVKLFHLSDFFVEIWYSQTSNKIDKVMVVDLDDVIHLYEKNIDISDLFKPL